MQKNNHNCKIIYAVSSISLAIFTIHCKKKVSGFPVPSRNVNYPTLPGTGIIFSDIQAVEDKTANLFYSVHEPYLT